MLIFSSFSDNFNTASQSFSGVKQKYVNEIVKMVGKVVLKRSEASVFVKVQEKYRFNDKQSISVINCSLYALM